MQKLKRRSRLANGFYGRRMQKMPRVSVIIPTYNRNRFIVKAIDSVLSQTFTDYEIIVIDDGSIDETQITLKAYATKIRYYYQNNSGVSSARNKGIGEARGEWVAFLDSDDEWEKSYLYTQVAQIKKFPNAVAHIVNAVTVFPDGEKSNHFEEIKLLNSFGQEEYLIVEKPFRFIIEHSPWFLQSSIMRCDLLLQTGIFDPELSIAEDLDVIARMALKGMFTFCNKICVEIYRRQEPIENLGSQDVKKGIYTRKAFGKVYESLFKLHELTSEEKSSVSKVLSSNWRALGNILLRAGRRADARYYYKKSLSVCPSAKAVIKYISTFLHHKISLLFVQKGKHILPG